MMMQPLRAAVKGFCNMLTRRAFLRSSAAVGAASVGLAGYGSAVELWRHEVTRYRPQLPNWPEGQRLRIAVLADIHACEPWMSAERIAEIVAHTNALTPDIILLLGDYAGTHLLVRRTLPPKEWAREFGRLRAPLGVHAILGNNDWLHDSAAQANPGGRNSLQRVMEDENIAVYQNEAARFVMHGQAFWLAGLGSLTAFRIPSRNGGWDFRGVDDMPATLKDVTPGEPVLLMMHEPDSFPKVPAHVALSVCGHTHGGQVAVAGFSPFVPSQYGQRYAYGHIVEDNRHLIVSAGLGCGVVPMRFGVPPEVVLIDLGTEDRSV